MVFTRTPIFEDVAGIVYRDERNQSTQNKKPANLSACGLSLGYLVYESAAPTALT